MTQQSKIGQQLRSLNRAQRRQLARQQRKSLSTPMPKMLAVVRPAPEVREQAIERLQQARADSDQAALSAVVTELPHTLVGWYPGDGSQNIVSGNGVVLGTLQPGDSLVKLAG